MKKFLLLFLILTFPLFVSAADRVEINTASLQQLETLTGIGPVKAQAIIDARPFSSIDDLDRAKGIGPKTLQKIKDQGLAYVDGQAQQTVTQTPAITPEPTPEPKPPPAKVYPGGIFINEILPNPQGPDGTDEWIELYNSNNSDVDLSGWQLQDQQGTITTYTIPQNTKILSNGFLVFKRPDTNIMLNNDQDGLVLMTPDGKTVDSLNFTSAPLGQSYNKVSSDWKWSTTLTPGAVNIITAIQPITDNKTLPATQKSDNSKVVEAADLSQAVNTNQDKQENNPWFLFFTVLATTVVLAAAVLFIKFKFQKENVRT